jgi:uncharacterized protein (TIGR00369 family)
MPEDSHAEQRTRNYRWAPVDAADPPLATRNGVEYFDALARGHLPPQPITETIGWKILEVSAGRLKLSLIPEEFLFHGGGLMHGGVMSILLDSAMSGAVLSSLTKGQGCTTLQLNVHFVRAVRPGASLLLAEGWVKHAGRTTATAEGQIMDETGRLFAHATTTCFIFNLKT